MFTLCLAVGYLMGFAGNSVIIELTGSAGALFAIVTALLLLSAILVLIFVVETPTQLHLHHHDQEAILIEEGDEKENLKEQLIPEVDQDAKPEPKKQTWQDIVLNIDFLVISICFGFIGMLRDGFFVWLNPYLQARFKVAIGSTTQLIAFAALTVGTALSAFVSAGFNEIFKDNNSLNGLTCFALSFLCYLLFGLTNNVVVTIIAIGCGTTFVLAIIGIRRIMSMTVGGYELSGFVTGVLGAGM